ncbi:sensor histidine kinase [Emticicia sp. 17c]|uniref:sensor histidine kinase n=1 Tax=Emticicia sp. 17c TaxID=3127704 RepID=UPI00301BAADE
MYSFQKFRRYEFWFITLSVAIYITRRLFQIATEFDTDVELAENAIKYAPADVTRVSIHTLWKGLASYNHELNTIFPIIGGGILLLMAWYTFHYMAIPRWKAKGKEQQLFILYLFLTVLFAFSGVFIYEYFKLYWRFKHDSHDQIIGFKVYSLFRKSHLLSNTMSVLTFLGLYEVVTQGYYYIKGKLYEETEKNYQYLDYVLVTFIAISILIFALLGELPVSLWNGSLRDIVLIVLSVGTVYIGQKVFTERVMPYMSDFRSKDFSVGITIFLAVCGIGGFGFYVVRMIFWASYARLRLDFRIEEFLLIFMLLAFASAIVGFLKNTFFKEKTQLRKLFNQKTAELSMLRSQINPHFLFNALNTLYAVSLKENAEKTADGIQKLGDMMRFMLNENNQDRIPLSKEIEYLQNYIEIQQMRIAESDNIEIKVNIQPTDRQIFIAPMLLNPFIENAFKHGISFRHPSWIYITLTSDDTRLYFKVHNSFYSKSETDPEKDNNGIGLENVKKRLDLIYKNRYTLDIQQSEQDFFVSLTVTYW